MRATALVLALFALAPLRATAGTPSDHVQLGQQLDDREGATHVKRDAAAVEALWSQDLVVTNLFGTVLTRAQAMARARKGLIQFSEMNPPLPEAPS